MVDAIEVLPDGEVTRDAPLKKVIALIGDNEGTRFGVNHPAAPNVIAQLYRAVGGDPVSNPPTRQDKHIIYSFAQPPKQDEFIAVVIG